MKIQDFGVFADSTVFSDISTLNVSRTVTPKPINYIIFRPGCD